jgi:hypothetical protein
MLERSATLFGGFRCHRLIGYACTKLNCQDQEENEGRKPINTRAINFVQGKMAKQILQLKFCPYSHFARKTSCPVQLGLYKYVDRCEAPENFKVFNDTPLIQ